MGLCGAEARVRADECGGFIANAVGGEAAFLSALSYTGCGWVSEAVFCCFVSSAGEGRLVRNMRVWTEWSRAVIETWQEIFPKEHYVNILYEQISQLRSRNGVKSLYQIL
jgi:hypothetical protein